jgi:hypothetical protein
MLTKQQKVKLEHKIIDRLLARLEFMPFNPDSIMVLGYQDNYLLNKLSTYYNNPELNLYGVFNDCQVISNNNNNIKNNSLFKSNFSQIALANNSIDFIIANFAKDNFIEKQIINKLQEIHRVLTPEGLLLFTCIDTKNNTNTELVLNYGDLLLNSNFCDPVVDQELINVHHGNVANQSSNNTSNNISQIIVIHGHALGNKVIETQVSLDCE